MEEVGTWDQVMDVRPTSAGHLITLCLPDPEVGGAGNDPMNLEDAESRLNNSEHGGT